MKDLIKLNIWSYVSFNIWDDQLISQSNQQDQFKELLWMIWGTASGVTVLVMNTSQVL